METHKCKRVVCIERMNPASRIGTGIYDAFAVRHARLETYGLEMNVDQEIELIATLKEIGYEPCSGEKVQRRESIYKERDVILNLLSVPCVRTDTLRIALP